MIVAMPRGFWFALCLAAAPAAGAAPPAFAVTEINYLLDSLAASGCEFYRNGTWYDAKRAQAHLRLKYDAMAASDQIDTADDFVNKVASGSSLSGQAYEVRCSGRAPMKTREWLSAMLARYRAQGAPHAMCGAPEH